MSEATEVFGTASWLWPNHRLYDLYNVFAKFRRDFELSSVPDSVRLCVTADQGYRLWINGRYVTRGPARGIQKHWPYDELEIGAYLTVGTNRVCAEAYNPGHSTYQYVSQNSAGFICAAKIGDFTLVTDESWLCSYETARLRDTALYSRQLFHQEHIDGRKYDRDWIDSPASPSGWQAPELTAFGSMPWHDLEPRGTPQLRETKRKPLRAVSSTRAATGADYASWRNVTEGLAAALKGTKWEGVAPDVAETTGGPYRLSSAGRGSLRAIILDMGETVVGPCSLSVNGGRSGEVVDLFFFEMLTNGTEPTIPFPAFCEASMSNRLVLKDGHSSCDFFHLLGFRYVLVAVHESTADISFDIAVSDTGYPYREQGRFECSDETLNGIWRVCRRTEQVCSLDSYVDTPWREQAQWWGDSGIQFRNTLAMDWDPRLMARGLRSIIRQRAPNGLTYGMAPTMAHNCILPDYTLSWTIFCYEYYSRTGDLSVFTDHLEEVEGIFSYFENEAPRIRGLLACDRRYWLFLDWSTLRKDGAPTLYSMLYLHALRLTSRMLVAAELRKKALILEEKAKSIESTIEELCFDPDVGLYSDGYDPDGEPLGTHSVHVQTMALALGLGKGNDERMLEARILPFLRGEKIDDHAPSAYWATFVLSVARQRGYHSLVLEYIRRRWSPMIEHGTTFEVFGPEEKVVSGGEPGALSADWGNFSASHAWTSHPMCHLSEILGGITETAEEPATVNFSPWFEAGIDFVEVRVPNPSGLIESSWRRGGSVIEVRLTLPRGVRAMVRLPGFVGAVEGDRRWEVNAS